MFYACDEAPSSPLSSVGVLKDTRLLALTHRACVNVSQPEAVQ